MRYLELLIAIDHTDGSTRTVNVPSTFTLLELHFIITVLCKWEVRAYWEMKATPPRDTGSLTMGDTLAWAKASTYEVPMPDEDYESDEADGWNGGYRGDGILVSDSSFMMSNHLDWSKDARTYRLSDVFGDPANPITSLKYHYTASKAISCEIFVISEAHVQDAPEDPLPIVLEIEGPGRDYDGGYISTRKPQLLASQKRLDKIFSASPFEQATNSRSKCAFCIFAKCQLPLGRGCYLNSGKRCCHFCAGHEAYSDRPLSHDALNARITALTAAELADYEARCEEGDADFAARYPGVKLGPTIAERRATRDEYDRRRRR